MITSIIAFNFGGKDVRTAGTFERPLFIAADVCRVLGINKSRDALLRLPDSCKGRPVVVDAPLSAGGPQAMATLTEAGVYRLIFNSRKLNAEAFQVWVTEEVLPSIRKTGAYALVQRNVILEKFLLDAPAEWKKEFSDQFFAGVMRIYGHAFTRAGGTPGFVGHFINEFVYETIFAGLPDELKAKRSADTSTFPGIAKLHQYIKAEHKELLRQQINTVEILVRGSASIEQFRESFRRAFNKEDQLLFKLLGRVA